MKIPDIIKQAARDLRKNMTLAEKILWESIRYDFTWHRFLRQKPIYVYTEDNWLDRYIIPDFYSHNAKLIIEIDGKVHNIPEILLQDEYKDVLTDKLWIKTLRFTNKQIQANLAAVIQEIENNLT